MRERPYAKKTTHIDRIVTKWYEAKSRSSAAKSGFQWLATGKGKTCTYQNTALGRNSQFRSSKFCSPLGKRISKRPHNKSFLAGAILHTGEQVLSILSSTAIRPIFGIPFCSNIRLPDRRSGPASTRKCITKSHRYSKIDHTIIPPTSINTRCMQKQNSFRCSKNHVSSCLTVR